MLITISPAKRLNETANTSLPMTTPRFQVEASNLAKVARELTAPQLQMLMAISPALAELNQTRFATYQADPAPEALAPAALMFAGDTYLGLEAETLSDDAMRWAQNHLRILSGLYGVLRPLDGIQPYRLEMGSRLNNPKGKSLYDYWGTQIAKAFNEEADQVGTEILVNCASVEYFSAVDRQALNLRVITPVFMELRNGTPKIVSFYAKKARGAMARFAVENHLTDPLHLQQFDTGGYQFQPGMSAGDQWVFLRSEAADS